MPATLTPKTLFVVGAGASAEANLPIGSKLTLSIASALNFKQDKFGDWTGGNGLVHQALRGEARIAPGGIYALIQACHRIRDAMPQAISIDNFIDQHSEDKQIEICGKLAIVREILGAESNSLLFVDSSNRFNKMRFESLTKTWFAAFWKLLTENCEAKDLEERFSKIAFVIFNYDRCIEHYLYWSLQNSYRIDAPTAARLVRSIEIFHPYGTVGSLPWQGMENLIEYGAEPNTGQLLAIAKQIKTFTEAIDEESKEVDAIRTLMKTSHRVVFLGFAFHKLNMRLLSPVRKATNRNVSRNIYASTFGLSEDDVDLIADEMKGGDEFTIVKTKNVECSKLFHEFWRSLSFV